MYIINECRVPTSLHENNTVPGIYESTERIFRWTPFGMLAQRNVATASAARGTDCISSFQGKQPWSLFDGDLAE